MNYLDPHEVMDCIEMLTIEDCLLASVVPACCDSDCWVEPDGYCEHGHPSVLIELKLIKFPVCPYCGMDELKSYKNLYLCYGCGKQIEVEAYNNLKAI